ncbi:hypothetical protein [Prosthecobacter sp.]|jgi:hypothetical protein|uniref:hypothetical protein n=1 Tax=Prosthecobacter sp. TaxID=1965333 RepID=UPI0037CBDA01
MKTPPAPMSKDAIAKALQCDRRTVSRIVDEYDISPAGTSPAGYPLYDLETVSEALEEYRSPPLPPMTTQERIDSLIAFADFHTLILDALAESVPPENMRAAFLTAMQRRKDKQEPQHLWARYAGESE